MVEPTAGFTYRWRADSGIGVPDGQPVDSWTDSVAGLNPSNTSTFRPTYRASVAGLNGQPAVQFSRASVQVLSATSGQTGLATFLKGANVASTVFVVMRPTTVSAWMGTITAWQSVGGLRPLMEWGMNAAGAPEMWQQTTNTVAVGTNGTIAANTSYVAAHIAVPGGAANSSKIYINGTQNAQGTAAAVADLTTERVYLGRTDANSECFDGYIAEILVYPRVLSDTERAAVHTYISDRYGIAVSDYQRSTVVTDSVGLTDRNQRLDGTSSTGVHTFRVLREEPSGTTDAATTPVGADAHVTGLTAVAASASVPTAHVYTSQATVADGAGITDAGQVILKGQWPSATVDSTGMADGVTYDKVTGNPLNPTIVDSMGISEPLWMSTATTDTENDSVGLRDTDPPDRQIGNITLRSASVTDSVGLSDGVIWSTEVVVGLTTEVDDGAGLYDEIIPLLGIAQSTTITDSVGLSDDRTYTYGTAQTFRTTVTDSTGFIDLTQAFRPDQVGLHLEVKSIDRATGSVRGPMPDRAELTLSPIFCDAGVVQFKYRSDGINAEWVAADEEFAVFLNDVEVGDLRFVVDELVDNDASEDGWITVAGRTTLALLEQAVVYPGGWPTNNDPPKHEFTAATPGFILTTLIERAQARGSITDVLHGTFDATVDSNGAAWAQHVTVSFDAGTNYLKVVQALVDMGAIEVRMAGRDLIVLNPDTLMVDRTTQASPLVFRTGVSVVDSPRKESTRDLRTALLVAGADNVYVEVKDDTAVAVYGRREGYENQGGINDVGTLTSYGQKKLTGTADVKMERTHGLTFADPTAPRPWFDFRLGDWVYSDYGTGSLERLRIKQWTIKEEESGVLTGTVSLNDLFADKIERLSRELEGIVSGATVVGGSEPPPDSEGDTKPPGVPTNVSINSSTYTDPSGIVLAQLTLSWTAVTTNADGSATSDIDHYEIALSYTGIGGVWTTVGSSTDNVMFYSPVRPGAQVWVKVRAVDTSANAGDWSIPISGTIVSDGQAPPIPSAPTVAPYLGQLKISWDGYGAAGESMPLDFKWVEVHLSAVYDFTPTTLTLLDVLNGSGTTMATGLDYETPYYVKFIAVDTSNNKSGASEQTEGVPELIISTDMSDIDKASITTTLLDDFNSLDARWARVAGAATTSVVDITDGLTGGSALAVAGDGTFEWSQNISFDPDVLYRVKARVRAASGTTTGKQYISAGTYGSFENDVAGWGIQTGMSSTCARSMTRAQQGVASMLITWGGQNEMIGATVNNLTVGHVYTFSAYVWVPTGSAAVRLAIYNNAQGATSTTTNAWQRLALTFTATATSHWVAVQHIPATGNAAIDLQASFETGVDGFVAAETGSGQTGTADLTFDASTIGQVPNGWTVYTSAPAQYTDWLSSNFRVNAASSASPPNSVLVVGTMNGVLADFAAVMRTADPYIVTPGQSVTASVKARWVTGNPSTSIVSSVIGIMTSATPTPPTAVEPIFGSNNGVGFQTSDAYLGDAFGTWVNDTGTWTIPTGHTYCWVLVGAHGYAPFQSGDPFTIAWDDVTTSLSTSIAPPTIASSTDRAYTSNAGTHSLKVTWNATGQEVDRLVTLSSGTAHTASAYVYVPAGSPAVTIKSIRTTSTGATVTATGQTTSTTGAWQRISVTDTPASGDTAQKIAFVNAAGTGTAYIDAFQVEVGSSATAWTGLPTPVLGTVYVDAAMVESGPVATDFTTVMAGTGRLVSVGLMGIASDGITRVTPTGTTSVTMHPLAAYQRDPGLDEWVTYEGFVKGTAATGSMTDTTSRDASTPGVMQTSTRYFRPVFAVNQFDGSGVTQVDMLTVETLAFPSNVIQDFMVANMSAGKITAGAINAVLIVAQGKILAGNPTGARVEMNEHGLYAYTDSGDTEFELDAANGSATFSGTLQGSTFRTAAPPYPRIELSGDFAQRIDCYPDMNAWSDPPGFRTGVTGSTTIEMFGGTNGSGTGGRITASFPNQGLVNPWTGGVDAYGSRITVTADQTEFTGPSTGGRILVGNTSGQGWIDRPYSAYVRAQVALVSGLAHGAPGLYTPYNSLEIRSTPIKDLYLIKGAFQISGGYLGDNSSVGSLPAGFPAPARTQIVSAFPGWSLNRAWLEIHAYTGEITLHGLSSGVFVNGYAVKVTGMYDTY